MTDQPRYILVDQDGIDTLHRNALEQCNLDDSARDKEVDEGTALAMKMGGHARLVVMRLRSAVSFPARSETFANSASYSAW